MSIQTAMDEYSQALRLGQKEYRELLMSGKDPIRLCWMTSCRKMPGMW